MSQENSLRGCLGCDPKRKDGSYVYGTTISIARLFARVTAVVNYSVEEKSAEITVKWSMRKYAEKRWRLPRPDN